MVKSYNQLVFTTLGLLAWLWWFSLGSAEAQTATAAAADISGVSNFIRAIISAMAGLAGLVATGFFVIGGLSYITSSGNPMALERAKRTILFAAFGLLITIAAFSLSSIIGDLGKTTLT